LKDSWHNNELGKILNEKYPHDFSMCDIDSICRWNNFKNQNALKRLIIYESKYHMEKLSITQAESLLELQKSIDWNNYDSSSGLFIIRYCVKPLEIDSPIQLFRLTMNLKEQLFINCFIDDFYKLISGKINIEELLINFDDIEVNYG